MNRIYLIKAHQALMCHLSCFPKVYKQIFFLSDLWILTI